MNKIENIESIEATKEGVIIKAGQIDISLSWDVIDKIAEVSELHYQSQMLKEFKKLIIKEMKAEERLNRRSLI